MTTWVGTVTVYVRDQDAAKAFYIEKLGFKLRLESPMEPGNRWLEVVPEGAQTGIVLYKDESQAGRFSGIVIETDDIQRVYQEMAARGVAFSEAPAQQDWGGIQAQFADQDGNGFVMVQLPAEFKQQ
jgi:predicted enzyme related to lactoylglutathione lyase